MTERSPAFINAVKQLIDSELDAKTIAKHLGLSITAWKKIRKEVILILQDQEYDKMGN